MQQAILHACALDALLFTDLATNAGSAPDIQKGNELRESVHYTALAQLLRVLSEGVAWDKVGDDACNGEETRR